PAVWPAASSVRPFTFRLISTARGWSTIASLSSNACWKRPPPPRPGLSRALSRHLRRLPQRRSNRHHWRHSTWPMPGPAKCNLATDETRNEHGSRQIISLSLSVFVPCFIRGYFLVYLPRFDVRAFGFPHCCE